MKKVFGIITLVLVAVLLALMVSATLAGQFIGQSASVEMFYSSPWFIVISILTVLSGTAWFCGRVRHKPVVCLLHAGMVLVIAGGLISHFAATNGRLHLRNGESSDWFVSDRGMKTMMPFELSLKSFEIEYYEGSDVHKDYLSTVVADGKEYAVSMNHPLRHKGYRIYQSSYDEDLEGSILQIGHDPVGIAFVYCGYIVMLLAMILFWFRPDTGFREALKRLQLNQLGRFNMPPMIRRITLACAWLLLFTLTWLLGLRWYMSGHIPMTDAYETMLLIGWLSMIITTFFGRNHTFVIPLGLILGGISVLVAFISKPTVAEPLKPVLDSPLLAVHVACMMVAYTLFGLMALAGLAGLRAFRPEARVYLADAARMALYPALCMLVLGTILGSFWGNISWGSYWMWDPKETWALITILVYAYAIHSESMPKFKNNWFFNWFIFLAFVTVLVTYFGVNLIFGGIHSYA